MLVCTESKHVTLSALSKVGICGVGHVKIQKYSFPRSDGSF